MVYEDILSSIAIYGIIAGIGIWVVRVKFPSQWQILFPSEDEKITRKLNDLDAVNRLLENRKTNLEDYKTKLQSNKELSNQISNLVSEIKELQKPETKKNV